MVIKKCKICGNEFEGHHLAKYCSDECRKAGKKITDKRYLDSERGKLKNREWQRKYHQSEKGKAANRKAQKRYRQSGKAKYNEKRFVQRKIAELNEMYDGDLDLILKDCPHSWREREAKMRVWFNESYVDGIIAKIESTPVCEVTGEKTNDLIIHHLYSFNTHPELGNDPANMVRISKEVHEAFHGIYGYGNNTPEQWMEFIEKQYGGD